MRRLWSMLWAGLLAAAISAAVAANGKAMQVEDIMRFRSISQATISDNGAWVTFLSNPDRGDGEAVAVRVKDKKMFRFERGSKIAVDDQGRWLAVLQTPSAIAVAKVDKDKKKLEALKNNLVLVNIASGEQETLPDVKDFALDSKGAWIVIHMEQTSPDPPAAKEASEEMESKKKKEKAPGSPLVVRHLGNDLPSMTLMDVARFAVADKSGWLAYGVEHPEGEGNGLYVLQPSVGETGKKTLYTGEHHDVPKMVFSKDGLQLAFLVGTPKETSEQAEVKPAGDETPEAGKEGEETKKKPELDSRYALYRWQAGTEATQVPTAMAHWYVPKEATLRWSQDGKRLFFGIKPESEMEKKKAKLEPFSEENFWSRDRILPERGLDIWHGQDPFIKTYDKTNWKTTSKADYLAVLHLDSGEWVRLADSIVPEASPTHHPLAVLLQSNLPYRRESTWNGERYDLWMAELQTGDKYKVAEALDTPSGGAVSPNGQWVAYYGAGDYHLFNRNQGTTVNLTHHFPVSMANEDHDYPSSAPGYGIAGWLEDNSALLIYDKYDIWKVYADQRAPVMLTAGDGRKRKVVYRIQKTDPDQLWFQPQQDVLLKAYYDLQKHSGFYLANCSQPGVTKLIEDLKTFDFIAKAKDSDRILFTREDFQEFPDLWVAPLSLRKPVKLTEENPQIKDFAWGEPQLVSWSSADGIPLQGVLIKPGNYEPGKRYPVLVYYYRFFSQRMYEFNQMAVNHRPNFPFYSSNGYAVFLPDIRFEVGLPGPSAVKCLVPGVQKLIDMGIADPNGIGLHGHSWSGYQTAFVITQTHIFKAAVAGAPVANMTSAYSGIRLGSGLARQFQYEKTQSRIGGSMWDRLDLYIENSPVFFADRIRTPLLIQFGDIDEAVPWQQGLELYLAMRRLGKDVILLQYRDEPHHLKKYPNKLDYTLKMKAYFDHHLKGEPAEPWITEGVPYNGE